MSDMPVLPTDIWRRTVTFSRHSAVIHAIDCDDTELAEIGSLRSDAVCAVEDLLCRLIEAESIAPRVPVWCLGGTSSFDWIDKPIRDLMGADRRPGFGMWLPSQRLVVISLRPGLPVQSVIVHELAHAVLGLLTDFFGYPPALKEGYACLCERLFAANWTGSKNWGRGSGPHGYLEPSEIISIADLILCSYSKLIGPAERNRFRRASCWLVGYLTQIGRERPSILRILAALRKEGITSPEGVLKWLEGASGKTLEQMEREFQERCMGPRRFRTRAKGQKACQDGSSDPSAN